MNDPRDKESLLNEVLGESATDGLRERLLTQTLRGAKRRRVTRRVRAAGSAFAVIAALGLVMWRMMLPNPPGPQNRKPGYLLVRTQPLPAPALVATQPTSPLMVVSSTKSQTVVALHTIPGEPVYTDVDDNALLAMAAPSPAILVHLGPHNAELVIVSDARQQAAPE